MQKDLKTLFGESHGLDEKSVQFLTSALEKSNLPGFDYIEFKQSISALAAMSMEAPVAVKSAFATASTLGVTKDKLLTSALHYKNVLLKEQKAFEEAVQRQVDQKIKSRKKELEQLNMDIENAKLKIAELEALIAKNQQILTNSDAELQAEEDRIAGTKSSFDQALQSIINQIDHDTQLIEANL